MLGSHPKWAPLPFRRVILASLNGMSHPLFPLISLENLVKIGRYSEEMVWDGCTDSTVFSQLSRSQDAAEGWRGGGGGESSCCDQLMCKDEKREAKGINQYAERLTQPAAERRSAWKEKVLSARSQKLKIRAFLLHQTMKKVCLSVY